MGLIARLSGLLHRAPGPQVHLETYPLWPVYGWTLERIAWALSQLDLGNFEHAQLLWWSMLKDDRIRNGLNVRASAVAEIPLIWARDEHETAQAAAANDVLVRHWRKLVFAATTERSVVKGVTMGGLKAAQVVWQVVDDHWLPCVAPWLTGRLRYNYATGNYSALTLDGPIEVPRHGDGREWVIFSGGDDQPWIDAAVRALGLPFFCRGQGRRDWLGYNAVHGRPQKKVKHPAAQREQKEVKELIRKVSEAVNGSVIPLPKISDGVEFDVELLEARADTYKCFPDLIRDADTAIDVTLLGQTGTTGTGALNPSRASDEVKERQFGKVTVADVAMLSEGLQPLLDAYADANQIDRAEVARPIWQTVEPPSPHLEAEAEIKRASALQQYVAAGPMLKQEGVKIDWQALAKRLKVPQLGDR